MFEEQTRGLASTATAGGPAVPNNSAAAAASTRAAPSGDPPHLVLLAETHERYANICRILSASQRGTPVYEKIRPEGRHRVCSRPPASAECTLSLL